MIKKITFEEFIQRANLKHDGKYDYSKSIWISSKDKVIIICPNHGEFSQTPAEHFDHGCNKCGRESIAEKQRSKNEKIYMNKILEKHGEKYNYDKVDYINRETEIIVNCPKHGDFKIKPIQHAIGIGCRACRKETGNRFKYTKEEFIEMSKKIHDNKFDYSEIDYHGTNKQVLIVCPLHGGFFQSPANHLLGCGCIKCKRERNKKEPKVKRFIERFTKEIAEEFLNQNKKGLVELSRELNVSRGYLKRVIKKYGLTHLLVKSNQRGSKNPMWKGYEDIYIGYWNGIISGSKVRNLQFKITIEHAWDLFLKQERKCALSNEFLFFASGPQQTASLDRIDSSLGYIEGNVQWVHKDLNMMKNKLSDEDFFDWVEKIFLAKLSHKYEEIKLKE